MLHLSNVAMHVDTCLPQPFPALSTPQCSVCWDDRYSVVFYVRLSFRSPPPLPPLYFTFVPKAFICTSLNCSARCWFSTDSVTPRSCTSTKTRQRSTRRTFNSSSAALTVLTIMFQLRLSQLCCCRRLTDSGRIPTSLLKLFKLS